MTRKANTGSWNRDSNRQRSVKARGSRTQKRTLTGGILGINTTKRWWARRQERKAYKKLGASEQITNAVQTTNPRYWNRTKKHLGAFINSAKSAAFLARFPIMHRNGNIHLNTSDVSVKYFILFPGQNIRTKLNNIIIQLGNAKPKLVLTSVPDNIRNDLLEKYDQYKDMFQFVEPRNAYDDSTARIFIYGFKEQKSEPEQQYPEPAYLKVESIRSSNLAADYIDPSTLRTEEPEEFASAELPESNPNNRKSSNKPGGLRMTNATSNHPLLSRPGNNI